MGNSTAKEVAKDPCYTVLQEYIKCMEVHEGVKPAPYEPEYCTIEKDAYRDCRDKLNSNSSKNL